MESELGHSLTVWRIIWGRLREGTFNIVKKFMVLKNKNDGGLPNIPVRTVGLQLLDVVKKFYSVAVCS